MIFQKGNYNSDGSVDVYAVLNRKQYNMVITGMATIEVPEGIKLKNKTGSRILFFECEDRNIADVLMDALDTSGISYQECL